jgi:hypothetical protein
MMGLIAIKFVLTFLQVKPAIIFVNKRFYGVKEGHKSAYPTPITGI